MIGTIARLLGINTLLVYVAAALIAAGSLWGFGAYKHHQGYSAGVTHERIAWEETRKRELAKQAAQKAADQARIDNIEADYLALQEKLNQERAENALEEAIRKEAADAKPALPRSLGQAINGVR